jgi:serine protease Do
MRSTAFVFLLAILRADAQTLTALSRSFETLVQTITPAVVQVQARDLMNRPSTGSGVIIDPEGYIATNAHVIGPSRNIQVRLATAATGKSVVKPAGQLVPAKLVGMDRETDIAILKIEQASVKALKLGNSEALKQGQLVLALGSPFGLENTVTMGVVSSTARQVRRDGAMIYIQTDASINPGNSGGPLIDTEGNVVGINTFIVSTSGANAGVGFAAPSDIVRTVYEQIRKNGRVRRGQIGIQAQTITHELAKGLKLPQESGVIVGDIAPGAPAEAAGIQVRDILLTMEGKPLENARQFGVNVYQRAGQTVTLEILRGSTKLSKQVAILEREPEPEDILSQAAGASVHIPQLAILALTLDEKVTPLLPKLRRLYGVVVGAPFGESDVFLAGDVIYEVNQTKIATIDDLRKAVADMKPGDSVVLQIERGNQLQYVTMDVR